MIILSIEHQPDTMKISVINYSERHRCAFDRDYRVPRLRVLHRSGKLTLKNTLARCNQSMGRGQKGTLPD